MPLDDRPCNRQFPAQLAEIVGLELSLPPGELLGWFTTPGDCEGIAAWLGEQPARHAVLSLDLLCYGGLVAARSPAVDPQAAQARLERVRALKQARPDLTLLASNCLPRLGMTVASAAALEAHNDLISYAMLVDRVERLGEEEAREELEAARARLDPGLLTRYLEVRKRNHELSRAALRLVADGVLDYLLLAQEDCAPVGLHIQEQEALREEIGRLGIAERVALHPGADEAGLVLLARHCAVAAGKAPRLCADYASEAGSRTIPRYEDRPLRETVESTLRAAGAESATPGRAEAILFLHTPIGEQRESSEAPPQGQAPGVARQADSVAERIRFASEAGVTAGVADLMYANGGDPELIAALVRAGAAPQLRAYAGWNTASNTLGTVVCQLTLEVLAARENREARAASERFLAGRLSDDYCYQTVVRPRAAARASELRLDQFDLGEGYAPMERYVREQLAPLAATTCAQVTGRAFEVQGWEVRVRLPWRRLFEVEVDIAPGEAGTERAPDG